MSSPEANDDSARTFVKSALHKLGLVDNESWPAFRAKNRMAWGGIVVIAIAIGLVADIRGAFEEPVWPTIKHYATLPVRLFSPPTEVKRPEPAKYLKEELELAVRSAKLGTPESLELAKRILERLSDRELVFPEIHQNLAAVYLELGNRAEAETHLKKEIELLDQLSVLPDAELPTILIDSDKRLKPEEIRAVCRRSRALTHYNWACLYAKQEDTSNALTSLQKAIELGYVDAAHIAREADFGNLRDIPQFRNIVASLENKYVK